MTAFFRRTCPIILLCYFISSNLISGADGEKFKAILSSNYTLVWKIVDKEIISFNALVKTTGWIGLGLNTKPKMDGADIVISGIKNDTRPYLFAYHGLGHHLIPEETTRWEIGYGKVFENWEESFTLMNLVRPLESVAVDGINIEDKELYLLWSYGEDDDTRKKHVARGVIRVNLINPSPAADNKTNTL